MCLSLDKMAFIQKEMSFYQFSQMINISLDCKQSKWRKTHTKKQINLLSFRGESLRTWIKWKEDNLIWGCLCDILDDFQITYLHCCLWIKDFSCLLEESCCFDLSLVADEFTFSESSLFSYGRHILLGFFIQSDILEKDLLN